jgi:hypothetical protein
MSSLHFLEIVMTPWKTLTAEERKTFDMTFANWLSQASEAELSQFEELESSQPSTHIRSNLTFVAQCLADPVLRLKMPAGLVEQLQAAYWPPAVLYAQAL